MVDKNFTDRSLRKPAGKTSEVWFLPPIIFFLASCASAAAPISLTDPTSRPALSAPAQVHLDEVRYAVVGEQSKVNAWSLFDESGASYAGYATRAEYWPRLFMLDSISGELNPETAKSLPSAIEQQGDFYVSELQLRTDMKWTDGTAFTAKDVVFTAQSSLSFQLTYDWQLHYDPQFLDHAEAVDSNKIRFYFKRKPNVAAWQYGVLQGPILQEAYWASKIQTAAALLPSQEIHVQMAELNDKISNTQTEIDGLYASLPLYKLNSAEYRGVQLDITRNQKEIDSLKNQLSLLQDDYTNKINSAHQALFALDDADEPLLGIWLPDGENKNRANPLFPSSFSYMLFQFYPSEKDAITALQNNDADVLLSGDGVDSKYVPELAKDPRITVSESESDRMRFLVFNFSRPELTNPALRRALDCLIDRSAISKNVIRLEIFVPEQNIYWHNTAALNECSGKSEKERRQVALQILQSAGYTWNTPPTPNKNGLGLLMPEGGAAFPKLTLLSPSADVDPLRAEAAEYIVEQARSFGIPLELRHASAQDVIYSIFSSKDFDVAIMGWRVGILPSYLCKWVGAGNPLSYAEPASLSACEAFDSASELTGAHDASFKLQSALMLEFPMIPLFIVPRYDVYAKGLPADVLAAPFR